MFHARMLKAGRASFKAVGLRSLAFLVLIHGSVAETLHTGRRSSASDAEVTVSSTGQTSVGSSSGLLWNTRPQGAFLILEDPDLYQELRKQLEKDQASRDTNSSIEAVDCQWYDWSPWSFCTKSCGGGVSKRKRTVAVKETTGGHPCEGDEEDLGRCNDVDCPLDCQWGDWTSWSDCTASCDGGVRQREKPVILEANAQGHACSLEDGVEVGECNTQRCSRDCEWSDWADWGACTVSCSGGQKARTRGVKIPAVEGGADCSGDASEEMSCNLRACPVDCVPSDWSSWEPCTTSCGNGTQVRRRYAEVQATGGGLACDNNFLEEQSCYEGPCPVSCVWGDWGSWSSCGASCGSSDSYVSSIRERDVFESAGGLPCQGDATRRKRCGFDECPVDCRWNDWGEWGACTRSCGGGLSERLRNASVAAAFGGSDCEGATRDVMACSSKPCPVDCVLSDWTPWTECSHHCGNGSALRYRSEAHAAEYGGKACPETSHEVQACMGSDCTPTSALIKSGTVTQITGAMQVVTEDPVGFSSNPMYALVAREAIRQFAKIAVQRVHCSVQPARRSSRGAARAANIWFSLLVPNATNVTAVRSNLVATDTLSAGRLLRQMLRRAGMYIFTNVTKFLVSMPKPTPPPPKKAVRPPKNSTRVVCFMKMSVPQPLLFAERPEGLAAVQRTIGETAKVADDSVHVSLMPNMALRASEEVEEQDLKEGPKEDLDSWFTLMAPAKATIPEADDAARDLAQSLTGTTPASMSERLRANLAAAELSVWDASEVKRMMCKAAVTGWEQEGGAFDQRVTGELRLSVASPRQFSQDPHAEIGTRQALAEIADVPEDRVRVSLMPSKATMYDEALLLELQGEPDYDVSGAQDDEVSAWYVIRVPVHPVDGAVKLSQKLNNLDLTLAELKLQDLLMDQGISEGVKISTLSAESGSAVSPLKPQAELEGEEDLPKATGTPPETTTTLLPEEDVEPPTVSNPGGGDEEGDDQMPTSQDTRMRLQQAASLLQKSSAPASGSRVTAMLLNFLGLGR